MTLKELLIDLIATAKNCDAGVQLYSPRTGQTYEVTVIRESTDKKTVEIELEEKN